MVNLNTKRLRAAISEYTQRSTGLALLIFVADILVYIATVAGAIFLENVTLGILCSVIAGLKISSLFVIAHDAAHDSFTSSRVLNKVIARISYLPSFHNYSLWLIAHNRLHHQLTNLKGVNSWSPLSKEEYDALPAWRRMVERFYRSPAGICFNYLIERWWKDKFFPYKRIIGKFRAAYWVDFLLVFTYLISFIGLLVYAGKELSHTSPVEVLILGFIIPFTIFNFMVGFSVYQQHTHENVPWFKSEEEREKFGGPEDITIHVRYPYWYNVISHNVMEHTAHHVDPRIPLYQLAKAQNALGKVLGDKMITVRFSLKGFLQTMAKCKLYDYENHCWFDFNGKPTSRINLVTEEKYYAKVA